MLVIGDIAPLYYKYGGEFQFSKGANGFYSEVPKSFVPYVVTLFPGEGFRNVARLHSVFLNPHRYALRNGFFVWCVCGFGRLRLPNPQTHQLYCQELLALLQTHQLYCQGLLALLTTEVEYGM